MSKKTLIECRKELGLTQQQVADRLGVTRSRYAQIERDPSNITIKQANAIARILGRSYQDIVFSNFVSPTNTNR